MVVYLMYLIFQVLTIITIINITYYNNFTNNITCDVCTMLVNTIKDEIKFSNHTITIIEKIIDEICHTIIIKPEREECEYIVENLYNISQWIINGSMPEDICKKLGFC